MRILWGERWQRGFLDYARGDQDYRISVRLWRQLTPIRNTRIIRKRNLLADLALVLEYLRHFGVAATLETLRSRRGEAMRRRDFVVFGLGEVVEGPDEGLPIGQAVAFLAPQHPACVERLVAPRSLILPVNRSTLASIPAETLLLIPTERSGSDLGLSLRDIQSWSRFSGTLPFFSSSKLAELAEEAAGRNWHDQAVALPIRAPEAVQTESSVRSGRRRVNPTAVLVGYGQHARTVVLPAVRRHLEVTRIHEIDPRVSGDGNRSIVWSTRATLGPHVGKRSHDAVLIAGYHHTHVPLAIEAISRGLYAVVEKPLATEPTQLDEMIDCVRRNGLRLFIAFQRRYHPFNELALADLRVGQGDPVSYHCIVYEHPLPPKHWYRWPNTRSRILSNGCHWIDHFLHLNDYADVVFADIHRSGGGSTNCSIELANGAYFTMMLADTGSGRRGVRDYIELRAITRTVTITDGTKYIAEDDDRVIRRAGARKFDVYRRMYHSIAERIVASGSGDSLRSIENSARLVIKLEQQFERKVDNITKRSQERFEHRASDRVALLRRTGAPRSWG